MLGIAENKLSMEEKLLDISEKNYEPETSVNHYVELKMAKIPFNYVHTQEHEELIMCLIC